MAEPSSTANPSVLLTPDAAALRDQLQDLMLADLLGPAGGPEEEVEDDQVRNRYILGMLAPRKQRVDPGEQDEPVEEDGGPGEDGTPDRTPAAAAGALLPSSFGLSFCVAGEAQALEVRASWGRYQRVRSATRLNDKGEGRLVWRRSAMGGTALPIPLVEGPIGPLSPSDDQPEVLVRGLVRRHDGDFIVSLFLINEQTEPEKRRDEAWLFQPELSVAAPDGAAVFRRRPGRAAAAGPEQAEAQALELLYRHQVEFATGHGVAVVAAPDPGGDPYQAVRLSTCTAPTHELPRQDSPGVADNADLAGVTLDMKELALAEDPAGLLWALPQAYARWIERQRGRLGDEDLAPHRAAAGEALARCQRAQERIEEGLALLRSDPRARAAFRFANHAMWLQRVHSLYAEAIRRGEDVVLAAPAGEEHRAAAPAIDVPRNRTWRLFQIAFVLLNLPGLTRLSHPDRGADGEAVSDLLWFPTGGGKTEAYLGLTAYTLGLRRLQGVVAGRPGDLGVAVLLRYTLRLLTLQQFQRATALICACEELRKAALARGERALGEEPFRIGLWVGQRTTPNRTEQADDWLKDHRGLQHKAQAGVGSPAQLTNCPWCGAALDPHKLIRVDKGRGRTLLYCGNYQGGCPFTERSAPGEGLPVVVVDEEIYRLLPALLIATVDKFAQMPWRGATQMLFGQVTGRCSRHGFRSPDLADEDSHPKTRELPAARTTPQGPLRPPDLIIQDELHLISGPLGTLTALYETAVDALCTWTVDGQAVRPKVIASTATVRRASEQVQALFLRQVQVFPPQALEPEDNFFSVQRSLAGAPGRRYLGICAPGRRLKALLIRVYVAALAAAQRLYLQNGVVADPFMTVVGYFNAMRELAGMRRLVEDDVRTRLRDTDKRGLAKRHRPIMEELTSRKSSADIPVLLDRLELQHDPRFAEDKKRPWPLDVLLATNMISVGVDVKRLGLMVVAGQPKTTAEYIQATSRVGRAAPGLVLTVYNWARPRDLSHYECFGHYHATFYQHVEALSVTPFSPGALQRGLAALLVALVRLSGRAFAGNKGAEAIKRTDAPVQAALQIISRRAELVAGSKARGQEVRRALEGRLDAWLAETGGRGGTQLGYRRERDGKTRELLKAAGLGVWEAFTCLNSLREVEPTVALILDERGMDEPRPGGDVVVGEVA